jgi:hypothetical protein
MLWKDAERPTHIQTKIRNTLGSNLSMLGEFFPGEGKGYGLLVSCKIPDSTKTLELLTTVATNAEVSSYKRPLVAG